MIGPLMSLSSCMTKSGMDIYLSPASDFGYILSSQALSFRSTMALWTWITFPEISASVRAHISERLMGPYAARRIAMSISLSFSERILSMTFTTSSSDGMYRSGFCLGGRAVVRRIEGLFFLKTEDISPCMFRTDFDDNPLS